MDMRDIVKNLVGRCRVDDRARTKTVEFQVEGVNEPSFAELRLTESGEITVALQPKSGVAPYTVFQQGEVLYDGNGNSLGYVFEDDAIYNFLRKVREYTAELDYDYGLIAETFLLFALTQMSYLDKVPYKVWIGVVKAIAMMNTSESDYRSGSFAPNYASHITHDYRFSVGGENKTHVEVCRLGGRHSTTETGEVIETDDKEWNSFIGESKTMQFKLGESDDVKMTELMKRLPIVNQIHLHEAMIQLLKEVYPQIYSHIPEVQSCISG